MLLAANDAGRSLSLSNNLINMKSFTPLFCLLILAAFTFTACDKCTELRDFVRYEPVYIDQAEFNAPVSFETERDIEQPGVIATYGDYLFINEYNAGVHMINNANPASPVHVGFIAINNNKHFAIKDGILLANRYNSLVAVDIRTPNQVKEVRRIANVFPDEAETTANGIISHYVRTSERGTRDCSDDFAGTWWRGENEDIFVDVNSFSSDVMSTNERAALDGSGSSTSSSAARFTLSNDFLYVLNQTNLEIFDVSAAANVSRVNTSSVNWGAETLFPLNDFLFVGGRNGVDIYNLSVGSSPQFVSRFEHTTACDPVVADEKYAYVTLRSGTTCDGFTNQLDILNIENIQQPRLIASRQLSNPRGLTIMNDMLVICDGSDGVVVFDVSDREAPTEVGRFTQEQANDVLPVAENLVVVSGSNSVFTLDVSDPASPSLVTFIKR